MDGGTGNPANNRRPTSVVVNGHGGHGHEHHEPMSRNMQNHILVERSLDHQQSSIPPSRTAHIHNVNSRKTIACSPAIIPPRIDSINPNQQNNMHGRLTNNNSNGVDNIDDHSASSSSSPPTDSVSQRTSTALVAATATMPRGGVAGAMNGRKKKSVTIGTFTTVETFDPNQYPSSAAV